MSGSSSPLLSLFLPCTHNVLYLFFFLIFQRNYFFFWLQQLLEFICICHKAGVSVTSFPNIWLLHLSSESATLIISFHPLAIVSFLPYSEDVIPCFPKFTYHGIRFKKRAVNIHRSRAPTQIKCPNHFINNSNSIHLLSTYCCQALSLLTLIHLILLKLITRRIILLICPL